MEGVTYTTAEGEISDDVEVPEDGITIEATGDEGYELTGQTSWSFEFQEPEGGTEPQPEAEPAPEPEPEPEAPAQQPAQTGPSSGLHAQSSSGEPYSQVWDQLAQCESGGDWSIDTGNGFYGGLQFQQSSWEAVGGEGRPNDASKEEQIQRAYALWQQQGWGAWPHCTQQVLPSQGVTGLNGWDNDPGGYGESYLEVHGTGVDTVSSTSSAEIWNASYSVPLREEADSSSDRLVQIPRGSELEKLGEDGSWIQVRYTGEDETLTGWVNTDYVMAA